jgi:sigma-B regulation protein RsbU (phosphoserine phosphatase)
MLLFWGLCVVMAVVCILSFVNAVRMVNKPFPGFLVYPFPYIGSMGHVEWTGPKADLKLMDRIVSVNGAPVDSGKAVMHTARRLPLGSPIHYVIDAKGQPRDVKVRSILFTIKDFLLVFIIPFVCGTSIFTIGLVAYILKPNTRSSWVFFIMCLFLGIYIVSGVEIQSTYLLAHLHYWIITPMPAAMLHMGLVFPERKRLLGHVPWLEYLVYLPAVLIAIGFQCYLFAFDAASAAAWIPDITAITSGKTLFTFTCVLLLIGVLLHSLLKASSTVAKVRAGMVLFGITMAFLPTVVIMVLVHFFKFQFPWNFLPFFGVFFPASIAYSIVRHNLFDADTIIKRTVGYFAVTGIVLGLYALVTVFFNVFMGQYRVAQSSSFPIIFTLIVILIFNPLRTRVQTVIDRVFFRKEYDYGKIVDTIGQVITSVMEMDKILARMAKTFTEDMFIEPVSVMLLAADGQTYRVFLAEGDKKHAIQAVTIDYSEPLMRVFEETKTQLTRYDLLEAPQFQDIARNGLAIFNSLRASLIVPMIFQERVIGLLNLGEKKTGKAYNREDIELLHTLANQGAVAIENALLFHENLEKQRMEEELNIARALQTSMLPGECPQIDGFNMAAISLPAMEVGGDFYDFAKTPDGHIAMVIGDVSGKSVSGALVMSAARSIFRMLSEEGWSVKDIMGRANRRTRQDIKTGMFVALLYAVIDSGNNSLRICSAGQTQPVHLIRESGEAVLVETEGDTFPLGILDDVDYEETHLPLQPGDKIIFYTDGIVEAMNAGKEIFGFERLLDTIRNAADFNAADLLDKLMADVNGFVGDAKQHDDLTVIVLEVNA